MVKVISLSNEAYERLKGNKGSKSFSEVVLEFVPVKKKNMVDLFGIAKDRAGEWKDIEKRIYEERKKFKLRTYKL